MAIENLASKTIIELRELIGSGDVSPDEVVSDVITNIDQLNSSVRAYLPIDLDRLGLNLKEQLKSARRGRLYGIPITVKDNICIKGEEITCASRILQGFRSPYDATVIERLQREGALIIPRANMDEFAFGSSTENSAFGATLNPWASDDDPRVPGGSSGGCAAAVASDMAVAAIGSDTGGSIRQPASFCGVVGMKPTYGRVSRYGLVAFASSLDQIGPLTKDVRDAAILLSVMAGHDARDSTSAPVDVPDYLNGLGASVKGLRAGIPELPAEGLDSDVKKHIDEAIIVLKNLGCVTVPIKLPHTKFAVATYYIIATAEASSNLARYDGVQYGLRAKRDSSATTGGLLDMYLRTRTEGLGAESKRRILLGTYVLSQGYYDAYYLKGMKVRTLIKQDFDEAFKRCDFIALPTSPTPAFRLKEKVEDPLKMYLSDIYTISANLSGVPALSVPCGASSERLPIGLQIAAPPFREDIMLQVACAYERERRWISPRPRVCAKDRAV